MVKKILIVNHPEIESLKDSGNHIDILKLKHPKSNELRSFALISDDLYEFISLNQDGNSMFIDDSVQSDYQCVFATKFDFRYFLISTLQSRSEYISIEDVKSCLIDQSSADENVKKTLSTFLKNITISKDLDDLFDVKKSSKKIEIKYNQEKCLDFLKNKVELLQKYLEKARSNEKQPKDSQEKNKSEAYELICQYLSAKLAEPLRKHMGLSSPFESSENHDRKRTKTNEAIVLN